MTYSYSGINQATLSLTPNEAMQFGQALPMGWVSSPPYFCALKESMADVANARLQTNHFYPLAHPLSETADHPSDLKPVPKPFCTPPAPDSPVTPTRDTGDSPPPALPEPRGSRWTQPLQRFIPERPLAYIDLYMDDFLGLAQGHPRLRDRVQRTIFHSIDKVFRPNDASDAGTA